MKKYSLFVQIIFLFLLILTVTVISCENDDENEPVLPSNTPPGNPQHGDIWTAQIGEEMVELKMIYLEDGTFWMGAPYDDPNAYQYEFPRHQVTLSKGFWMSIYEITQSQWNAISEVNPSEISGENHPVETVTWIDVHTLFLDSLNSLWGTDAWRLPTEAEWEYAARAGNDSCVFCWGNDESLLDDYGWYSNNSNTGEGPTHHAVGQKHPNAWNLYDMYGNVFEWCSDYLDFYDSESVIDPTGPITGDEKIMRGGSWIGPWEYCRNSNRHGNLPSRTGYFVGFRIVYQE